MIHLIWIGDDNPKIQDSKSHWESIASQAVTVHRDDALLRPEWRQAYAAATAIQTKCDLLRLSILRKEGGWYFDLDIRSRLHLAIVELELETSKMFLTRYGSRMYQNDIIHCPKGWRGWGAVDDYIQNPLFPPSYVMYGMLMFSILATKHPDLIGTSSDTRYRILEAGDPIFLRHGKRLDTPAQLRIRAAAPVNNATANAEICETCRERPEGCWAAASYSCTNKYMAARSRAFAEGICPIGKLQR